MRFKVKEFFKQENNSAKVIFSIFVLAAFLLVFSPAIAEFMRYSGSTGWGYGRGYGRGYGYGWDGGLTSYRTDLGSDAVSIEGYGYGYMAAVPSGSVYTVASTNLALLPTSGLVTIPGGNVNSVASITFNGSVTVTTSSSAGTISVAIPSGAILTPASGTFNFSSIVSTDQKTAATGAISGGTVRGALQFGIPSVPLTSSSAVTITIPVGTDYNGTAMRIYKSETSASTGYSAHSTPTCTIASGNCIFTTTSFSYFAISQTNSGGGGGGGGGGDSTAPTGTISINAGAASTTSRNVTLTFTATDAGGSVPIMGVSNTSDFANVSWEAYASTKDWTLTEGNGTKTVYVKFKDSSSNISSAFSDTITLTSQATDQVVDVPVEPVVEPVIPPASRVESGTYTYDYVGQSAYPATLAPGATVDVWIDLKNTGTSYWYNEGSRIVRFGTGSKYGNANQQRDYNSEFADISWPSANRAAKADKVETKTGETARFLFKIKAPSTPGVYKAYFAPVADGYQWMQDIGIYWQITVSGSGAAAPVVAEDILDPNYGWELISQSPYPSTLAPNAETEVWIEVKNTGKKSWLSTGANPLRLGAGSKYGSANQQRDYSSEFANTDWLSANRPTAILHPEIKPGWHTRFQFKIKAPATAGTYKAYFTPVLDGLSWLKDIGLYWQITVQ